ncbi:hypothetical protein BH09PSE2_BH09PSE2_00080 [soil metagenome]
MSTSEWFQSFKAMTRRPPVRVAAGFAAVGFLALAGVASVAHGSGPADPAPLSSLQRLQIAFAPPAPIILPPAPTADERLAVLVDSSQGAVTDPALRDSLGLAQVAALERREQAMRDRETAAYEAQDRRLQAAMAALMRPTPVSYAAPAPSVQAEAETVAATCDTARPGPPPAD